jgi:hypothetical protein
MKKKNNNSINLLLGVFFLCLYSFGFTQDSTKKDLILNVGYYQMNNKVIYLIVHTKTKINSKFQPASGVYVNLYLDSISEANYIAKAKTDVNGIAKVGIPLNLKNAWLASANHTFIGITEANKDFNKTTSETPATIARLSIDTSTDGKTKNIIVSVLGLKNNSWLPAKGVEMKVGINRLGGILSAGDEATYTTDSTGSVTVALKKDSLPGDKKGNILLVAKVEDNDQFGNLVVEKTVPWGVALQQDKNFFDQRTLWSTRFRTPAWLLIIAYFLGIGVWGTIIYLIFQIIKIKKLGTEKTSSIHQEQNTAIPEAKIQLSK